MTSIHTLLIANRGEIAVRVINSARLMGIRTVAVFAEADRDAPHVALADTAVFLGDGPVNQTYLDKARILSAMQKSGANAVYPGYGFLSEDADFAEQVNNAGHIWVGPPPAAMRAMASKAQAKQTLEPKGVPMIPGYHGDDQDVDLLTAQASDIGYPLLVKASAGGGGKGMRVVEAAAELRDAIDSAKREAKNSFGDDRLLLEKFLVRPRHIEVQILADEHGKVLSLFERDCSVQRRHQKVLEEAPAANLPQSTREAMWLAAETAAREIGYVGAGTVEFILSADGAFYFLEMNTRLQVEHPVTECITGLDLVAWQLKVAQGEPLSVDRPAQPDGHAIEVRLYAEDPAQNFTPMVGRIEHLSFPSGPGIRIDSGVFEQTQVSSFYDPMLAKIIVHAKDRPAALTKLRQVLDSTRCFGVTTNLAFLRLLVKQPEVADLTVHTRWLDDQDEFYQARELHSAPCWAALASVLHAAQTTPVNPWQRHRGWRASGQRQWLFAISESEQVSVIRDGERYRLNMNEHEIGVERVSWTPMANHQGRLRAQVDGVSVEWHAFVTPERVWLDNGDRKCDVNWWLASKAHDHDVEASGRVVATLPGVVTALYKKAGDRVDVGDKLLSYEAMKMETTLTAEVAGVLQECDWQVGDQLSEGDLLFTIDTDEVNDD